VAPDKRQADHHEKSKNTQKNLIRLEDFLDTTLRLG
jgi:hypothetical protein